MLVLSLKPFDVVWTGSHRQGGGPEDCCNSQEVGKSCDNGLEVEGGLEEGYEGIAGGQWRVNIVW